MRTSPWWTIVTRNWKGILINKFISKRMSNILYQIFIFSQVIAPQKLWKIFFISSKKLFSFLRYSVFYISVFPSFLPFNHCVKGYLKINPKIYDVVNCLNKNLITHFVWYYGNEKRYGIEALSIDKVLNEEHFMSKSCRKCAPLLVNNPKQLLDARNYFENKIFWKRIIKNLLKSELFPSEPSPF